MRAYPVLFAVLSSSMLVPSAHADYECAKAYARAVNFVKVSDQSLTSLLGGRYALDERIAEEVRAPDNKGFNSVVDHADLLGDVEQQEAFKAAIGDTRRFRSIAEELRDELAKCVLVKSAQLSEEYKDALHQYSQFERAIRAKQEAASILRARGLSEKEVNAATHVKETITLANHRAVYGQILGMNENTGPVAGHRLSKELSETVVSDARRKASAKSASGNP